MANGNKSGGKRPQRALGVQRQGGVLCTVVVRLGKPGEAQVVVESFNSADVATAAVSKAPKSQADIVVGVLPAAAVTWRRVEANMATGGSPEAVAGALGLIAEVNASSSPAHRRCAGALRVSSTGSPAMGVCAWVQDMADVVASLDGSGEVQAYAPAHVALAWLMRCTGRGVGVGVLAEPGSDGAGAITIVGQGSTDPVTCVARVLREDSTDAAAWRDAVMNAADETAGALSCEMPDIGEGSSLLALPPSTERPLAGSLPSQPGWVEQYGLALGAAAAALVAGPDEQPLLTMTYDPPGARGSVIERSAYWLSEPKRAAAVVAASLLLLLGVFVGTAWGRLAILRSRADTSAEAPSRAILDAAKEVDQYELTKQRRWPMSKIMAELVGSAPKGVNVETVILEVGKSSQITGSADTNEILDEWRSKLVETKVFDDIKIVQTAMATGVRFELLAKVQQPTRAMNVDAAALERIVNAAKNNATTAPDQPAATSSRSGNNSGRATTNNNRNRNTPAATPGAATTTRTDRNTTARPAEETKAPAEIPSPISDEQIAKLDSSGAMKEFVSRRAASQQPGLDETTKQRLKDEAAKCQARMQAARSGGAS